MKLSHMKTFITWFIECNNKASKDINLQSRRFRDRICVYLDRSKDSPTYKLRNGRRVTEKL